MAACCLSRYLSGLFVLSAALSFLDYMLPAIKPQVGER